MHLVFVVSLSMCRGHDTDVNGVGTLLDVGWSAAPFPDNTTAPSVGLRFAYGNINNGSNVTLDFVYTTYSTTTRPLLVTSIFNMESGLFCSRAVKAIDWNCAPKLPHGSLCSAEMDAWLAAALS